MRKLENNVPFEGNAHEATIIMLPYRNDTWRENGKKASIAFFEIINTIALYETVYVLVDEHITYSLEALKKPNIKILHINYNDCWARDTSPIFMIGKNFSGIDFRFNAWGGEFDGLYSDYQNDDLVAKRICDALNIHHQYINDFILEGGSIHTDGLGTFITTEACLLSKGRNPHLSKLQIEDNLKKYLNAKQIIWLPHGIVNDETNEHVDNIACFIKPDEIALSWSNEPEQKKYCQMAYDVLKNTTNINNQPYKITKIPMPDVMYMTKDEENSLAKNKGSKQRLYNDRLAGSYVNYYQGEKYVILPGFGCKTDLIVKKQFEEIYKDKKIHQINSKEILLGGGNIHCITMQIPKGE